MAEPYKGVYAMLDFPPYKFQEYPKWATIGGKKVLVQSQSDEIKRITAADEPEQSELSQTQLDNIALQARIAELEAKLEPSALPAATAVPASAPSLAELLKAPATKGTTK